MDTFITRQTYLLFGTSWLLQLLYVIGVESLQVLEPEKTIYNQALFHKQASLYTLANLEQNTTYEIRVSYPAVVPTDFTIRVIEPKQDGHFKSRDLLNIEKAVFTTGLSTQGYKAEVVAHRIGFPKDPERLNDPVVYNLGARTLFTQAYTSIFDHQQVLKIVCTKLIECIIIRLQVCLTSSGISKSRHLISIWRRAKRITMYWPRRILVLVLLWQSWRDSDCVVSQAGADAALNQVFGTTRHFSDFLIWLENENICLRRGEAAERACYILSDFETGEPGAILGRNAQGAADQWKADPFNNMQRCRVWYNRLWNSIAFILAGEREDTSPILLARAASSGRERYRAHRFQIGNAETFSKGKIGGEGGTIGGDMRLDVAASRADVAGTVRDVMAWMKAVMPV